MITRLRTLLRPLLVPSAVVFSWEVGARLYVACGGASGKLVVFPEPSRIIAGIMDLASDPAHAAALGRTLLTTLLGFALGTILALATGGVLGLSKRVAAHLLPSLHCLRSLPVVLYVPIALLVVTPDIRLPVVLASFVAMLYGAIPVSRAIQDYDPEKILFLRSRGYSRYRIALQFIFPEVAGALYTSASITITLALAVTVVAEMLLPNLQGVGSDLIRAKEASHYTSAWALTAVLAAAGFAFHELVLALWGWATPWARR